MDLNLVVSNFSSLRTYSLMEMSSYFGLVITPQFALL